jgi:hypothetical protein
MWYQRKTHKFFNRHTVYNGRKYDSKLEATVAEEIDLLIRAKQVVKVEPQKTLVLYGKNGGRICTHRVDFLLTFKDGHQEFWEAKGYATDIWRIKRELTIDNYPEIPYVVITARETKVYKRK